MRALLCVSAAVFLASASRVCCSFSLSPYINTYTMYVYVTSTVTNQQEYVRPNPGSTCSRNCRVRDHTVV